MDRRKIIMDMRHDKTLKGVKPAIVYLRQNVGKIYNGPSATFVMSFKNDVLHFQKLSMFLKRLKKKGDFDVNAARFNEYYYINKHNVYMLYLYDKDGRYMQIMFPSGTKDTMPYADNIMRILDELKEKGLKEIDFKKKVKENEPEGKTKEGKDTN